MEIYPKSRTRSMALVSAGILALLLVAVLSLSLSVRAEPAADLTLDKQVSAAQAAPGDALTYTIHIANSGPEASLWMTDTLPPEVTYVDSSLQKYGSGSASYADGVISWTGSDFGYGSWVYITFTVEISPDITAATIINTAEVTGTGALTTSAATTEVSPGQIDVLKTIDRPSVRPGEQVAYAIYLSNIGLGAVDPFSVTDSLPPEVGYAGSLNADGGTGVSCGEAGGVITCTGRLDPAEGVTITFNANVDSGLSESTVFTNTVDVAGAGLPVSASVAAMVRTDLEYFLPLVVNNYPPILTLTVSAPVNGVYTASFMYVHPPVEYVLQEATSPNFECNLQTYTTTEPYKVFNKGTTAQTWYYRVRADGGWGQGPAWSNVASASTGYYDDFTCDESGWPDEAGFVYYSQTDGENKYWRRGYRNDDYYRIAVDSGGPLIWFYQPDALAPYEPPTDKYCIEARVKFYAIGHWDNAALIIGANGSNTKLYMMGMSYASKKMSWGLLYKKDYDFPHKAFAGTTTYFNQTNDSDLSWDGWNTVKVSVDGDQVKSLYINGKSKLAAPVTMPGLSNMTRVGVLAGIYEVTPLDWRVDYFKVTPEVACTP